VTGRERGWWQAERGANPSTCISSDGGGGDRQRGVGGRQRVGQTPLFALQATEGVVAGREWGKPLHSHFE
jgi:hypothetical protein